MAALPARDKGLFGEHVKLVNTLNAIKVIVEHAVFILLFKMGIAFLIMSHIWIQRILFNNTFVINLFLSIRIPLSYWPKLIAFQLLDMRNKRKI